LVICCFSAKPNAIGTDAKNANQAARKNNLESCLQPYQAVGTFAAQPTTSREKRVAGEDETVSFGVTILVTYAKPALTSR